MDEELFNYIKFVALYTILYDTDIGNRVCCPLVDCWATIYGDDMNFDKLVEFMESIGYKNFKNHVDQIINTLDEKSNDNIEREDGTTIDCDCHISRITVGGESNSINNENQE